MNNDVELSDSSNIFELAPISLWLEDYSGLKKQFEMWRAEGITDIKSYLMEDPSRLRMCTSNIVVLRVNQKTLDLYEAADLKELRANLERVFRDDMLEPHIDEMVQLWNGAHSFYSDTINYSLKGRRIDIQLKGRILPGHEDSWDRVLLAIDDVTAREDARRDLYYHKNYAEGLFEHSPVSVWVEDFSRIKQLMDEVRNRGVSDFRVFTDVHPEFVRQCMSEIRVLDVNNETLRMFLAPDKSTLLRNLPNILRGEMEAHFREQLIDLWNGVLFQRREVVNYALDGTERHVLLQFSVLPRHEEDWTLVQLTLTDITARKKAEAYLEYLGKHDVLTKLHNRAFFVDEINRIERKNLMPISIIMVDVNGLKDVNDQLGHASGDALLRRMGEVLTKAVQEPCHAARIGGDEFAIVLPYMDEHAAKDMVDDIRGLIAVNNQYYSHAELSASIGWATRQAGETLESVAKRADAFMYKEKRNYIPKSTEYA